MVVSPSSSGGDCFLGDAQLGVWLLEVVLKLDNLLIRVEVCFSLGCDDHSVLPEQFLHVQFGLKTGVQFVARSFKLLEIVEGVKHPLVVSKTHGVLGHIVK